MPTSRTRFKEMRSVFCSDTPSMVHVYLAQMSVLYEDLRIELYGIEAKDLGKLDSTDEKYRRHYFLRRVIRLLDKSEEFDRIRKRFTASSARRWNRAVRFFGKHENFVKAVRNDVGGHFGPGAAKFGVKRVGAGVLGKFERTNLDSRRAEMRLHFAGEIAATATFRRLPGGEDKEASQARLRGLMRIVTAGWGYVTYATSSVAADYLWDRFR